MGTRLYKVTQAFARNACKNCLHQVIVGEDRAADPETRLLAVTHFSHLEPMLVGALFDQPINWMAREEYFATRLRGAILRTHLAFPVQRTGVPVRAIRRSVELLDRGETVGIFPEGRVATGADSMVRGGPMRAGVCLVSQLSGVPVTPVVVLGTEQLNAVRPWIPYRRAYGHMAFGAPIEPTARTRPGHAGRAAMVEQLSAAFQSLYAELLDASGLDDADVP